ncbi:hypothetical protein MANES_17G025635v8 [Manihot esculenta]|uniref:Uncharacterized protein n=3 Tax=Manihot esculenta TaxID=3983 RepID=A0ACB7G3J7_MANES|nr:hypothetical protein MANES_17G025635v8 [Manihot esculenta]
MGCASSKQKRCRRCRRSHVPHSPMPRSYSMHLVHPRQEKGNNYHLVALTSTTSSSLPLNSPSNCKNHINFAADILTAKGNDEENKNLRDGQLGISNNKELKSKEFSMGLIKAKAWSNTIQEKIPKIVPRTPVRTPPGEPETINAWELMAGLEEDDDSANKSNRFRSLSFDCSSDPAPVSDCPQLNGTTPNKSQTNCKSLWLQIADEEANSKSIPEFDPEIISTFRKALEDLSPTHPFHLNPPDSEKQPTPSPPSAGDNDIMKDFCKGENEKEKVVLYFTSLRGIRKTHEDCCHVRIILKGLGVRTDERDVSMHSGYKEELKELLGARFREGGLPKVFLGRKYIGGADEIRQLHEEGQLEKLLKGCGCEMAEAIGGGACEACGDVRFVPCETCFGSCKLYYERDDDLEEEEEEEEEEYDDDDYGFQRCPDCNENGLIRCPVCCY